MSLRYPMRYNVLSAAALLMLAACGGGSDDAPADGSPMAGPTTTDVTTTVVDGAIRNALVCIDKDSSGTCDPGGFPHGTRSNRAPSSLVVRHRVARIFVR